MNSSSSEEKVRKYTVLCSTAPLTNLWRNLYTWSRDDKHKFYHYSTVYSLWISLSEYRRAHQYLHTHIVEVSLNSIKRDEKKIHRIQIFTVPCCDQASLVLLWYCKRDWKLNTYCSKKREREREKKKTTNKHRSETIVMKIRPKTSLAGREKKVNLHSHPHL